MGGGASQTEAFYRQQNGVTGILWEEENDIAKISRSFFKGKVSWCPKEIRWKPVIIPSGFWLCKISSKNCPWQSKQESEGPINRSSHLQDKELIKAPITPETPFPKHCQQPPPKGIETKRNLSCQGMATSASPKSNATMWLCSKEALIIREQSDFLPSGQISTMYPNSRGGIIDCNHKRQKVCFNCLCSLCPSIERIW